MASVSEILKRDRIRNGLQQRKTTVDKTRVAGERKGKWHSQRSLTAYRVARDKRNARAAASRAVNRCA